jgi:TDG/mug DNA glycosylase family protein
LTSSSSVRLSAFAPQRSAATTRVAATSSGSCCTDRSADLLAGGLGLTDLAKRRASSRDAELLREDFDVASFIAKVERLSPRWVAFNGKKAAEIVSRYLGEGRYVALGGQSWTIATSRVFVLPSTSGANSNPAALEGKASKLDWFRALRRSIRRGP